MSGTVFIQIPEDEAAPALWLIRDGKGKSEPTVDQGDLGTVANAVGDRRVVVLVPATQVALTETEVPTKNRAQLARAVPFALEDEVSGDIEDIHFALGPVMAGKVPVCVVSRARMQRWLERLSEARISPDCLTPDVLALPLNAGGWTLMAQDDAYLLRRTQFSGFAVEPENLALVVSAALQEADEGAPTALQALCTGERAVPETDGLTIQRSELRQPPLRWLADGYAERSCINLLQGEFRTGRNLGERIQPWRPAIALLLLWLMAEIGLQVFDYVQVRRENASLDERIETAFRQAFPETKRLVNPRVQMEQGLAALRGGGTRVENDFLTLVASSGKPLTTVRDLRVQGLSYRNNALYLDLKVKDLQTLDQLKRAMEAAGRLSVTIQTATARNDGVQGRFQIRTTQP